jgi:hypothetical protein
MAPKNTVNLCDSIYNEIIMVPVETSS